MMAGGLEFVVDCWVLGVVADHRDVRALQGVSFLWKVLQKHRLAVDAEGCIYAEYSRQIARDKLLQEWWRLMVQRSGKVTTKYAKLTRRQSAKLIGELHFDLDDIPYVAVASVSASHLLVSEESDYREEIVNYLNEELGVEVLPLDNAETKAMA